MLPSEFTLVSYLWKTICTVLHLGPVIAYILLSFTVKESVKCIGSLNKFVMFTVKVATQLFLINHHYNHQFIHTNLT